MKTSVALIASVVSITAIHAAPLEEITDGLIRPHYIRWDGISMQGNIGDKMVACVQARNPNWPLINDTKCPSLNPLHFHFCKSLDPNANTDFYTCAHENGARIN